MMKALETIEAADELVELVAERLEGKIPSAGVIDSVAAKGFFELSEAVPGVMRVVRRGDAPEVEGGGAEGLSIENHLDDEGGAGGKLAMFVIGGGVGVKASAGMVIDESSSDGLMLEFGDIESGEAGFELVFEMGSGLGGEMIFVSDGGEEMSEDSDLGGVGGMAESDAFALANAPEATLFFINVI